MVLSRRERSRGVVEGVPDIRQVKLEARERGLEPGLEERDRFALDIKPDVGSLGQHMAEPEGDSPPSAADLENVAARGDAAVDPEQHAPLLGPPEPFLHHVDPLLPHHGEGRDETGVVREPSRPGIGDAARRPKPLQSVRRSRQGALAAHFAT